MTVLMAGVTLNVAQVLERLVLFLYLDSIDPSGRMASLTTALVFLGGLSLRLISGGGRAVGLNLIFVLKGLILGLPVGVLLSFLADR